jgi:hypothetical protein
MRAQVLENSKENVDQYEVAEALEDTCLFGRPANTALTSILRAAHQIIKILRFECVLILLMNTCKEFSFHREIQ